MALAYEMQTIPTSLFDKETHWMNLADKPDIVKKIKKIINQDEDFLETSPPLEADYIVDGGNLLYQVRWSKKIRYIT